MFVDTNTEMLKKLKKFTQTELLIFFTTANIYRVYKTICTILHFLGIIPFPKIRQWLLISKIQQVQTIAENNFKMCACFALVFIAHAVSAEYSCIGICKCQVSKKLINVQNMVMECSTGVRQMNCFLTRTNNITHIFEFEFAIL